MKLIILFIVIAVAAQGQKVTPVITWRNEKGIEQGAKLTATQLNAGTQTLTATFKPSSPGSYTVTTSLRNTNYSGEKYKTKFNYLKYLPYLAIALSVLLAIFLFVRNRDEVITMPENETLNYNLYEKDIEHS